MTENAHDADCGLLYEDGPEHCTCKLLPCPFCGGEASMSYSATIDSPDPTHRFLECDECGASGASVKIAGDDPAAKALAIAAWNTRLTGPSA